MFLYRFDSRPELVEGWTTDRRRVSARSAPSAAGGTAMYDTVAEAVPLAQTGAHRKKALVLISDGNDTSSHTRVRELRQLIRESEVLVYAIGIDASNGVDYASARRHRSRRPSRRRRLGHPVPVAVSRQGAAAARAAPQPAPPPPPPRRIASQAARARSIASTSDALRAHHRRQRRPHGDHRLAARSRSGDRRHRRRAEPAVLSRLHLVSAEGRQVAHDRGAGAQGQHTPCARARASSRAKRGSVPLRGGPPRIHRRVASRSIRGPVTTGTSRCDLAAFSVVSMSSTPLGLLASTGRYVAPIVTIAAHPVRLSSGSPTTETRRRATTAVPRYANFTIFDDITVAVKRRRRPHRRRHPPDKRDDIARASPDRGARSSRTRSARRRSPTDAACALASRTRSPVTRPSGSTPRCESAHSDHRGESAASS